MMRMLLVATWVSAAVLLITLAIHIAKGLM